MTICSFAQPIGQPLIVLPELLILTGQRIGLRFRPSLLRGQPFHDAGRPLPPPFHQVRGVKPVPPQHGADLAGPLRRIRLRQALCLNSAVYLRRLARTTTSEFGRGAVRSPSRSPKIESNTPVTRTADEQSHSMSSC